MLLKYLGVLMLLCTAAYVDAALSDVDYCSPAYMCSGRSQRHVLACNHTGVSLKFEKKKHKLSFLHVRIFIEIIYVFFVVGFRGTLPT